MGSSWAASFLRLLLLIEPSNYYFAGSARTRSFIDPFAHSLRL